jgi:hypothetical protein
MWTYIWFAATTIIAVWIVFFDGAEEIEGKLVAVLLVDFLAYFLTATYLKVYVSILWLLQLFALIFSHA